MISIITRHKLALTKIVLEGFLKRFGAMHLRDLFGAASDENYFSDISFTGILSFFASAMMVFGGVVPYIPQYREIKRASNADGFSMFVCLVLLIANTLRVLFWFGKHFESPLLAQSFIMIMAMLTMVNLCVDVRNRNEPHRIKASHFVDFNMESFWAWHDFASYIEFELAFSAIGGLITYALLDWPVYIEILGFLSVFAEAMLGMPQLYRNMRNSSTSGMSVGMVLMWTSGDTFKTVYFIVRHAPAQFYICGMLQVAVDLFILCQVWYYRGSVALPHKPAIQ